ncbi:phage baseplate protein [Secundilactobacillus pentosiphilus]|uniref:phage baseplate protein n=1 Tax=Secundilactobacillus pentosiphilus TaxID=1714682 RepID=UPI00350E5690
MNNINKAVKVSSGTYLSNNLDADARTTLLNVINRNSRGINVNADVLNNLIENAFELESYQLSIKHLDGKTYTESVADAFKYLIGVIDNIPGKVDNADMRMSMVAIDGTRFDTLRARLEYDLKYCLALANPDQDGLMPKQDAQRFELDAFLGRPAKVKEFNITRHIVHSNAIVQSFQYSRGTGYWYTCARVDNDNYGNLLHFLQFKGDQPTGEWMDINNTNHGSAFEVQTVGGVDHILVGLNRVAGSDPVMADITWDPKKTKAWGDAGIELAGVNTGKEQYLVFDETQNLVVIRTTGNHNNDLIQVWNHDEWMQNIGHDVYQFNIDGSQYYPCQGFDADNGKLYWHSGDDANSDERVSVFDYTGKVLLSIDETKYNLIGDDTAVGKAEPEGLSLVSDDGGNPMIAFGHVCGPQGARRYILHAYNYESWLEKLIQQGGSTSHQAIHVPVSQTTLSELGSGWWYATADQMRTTINDKPQDYIISKSAKTWYYAVLIEITTAPNGYRYEHMIQLRPDHKRMGWNRIEYAGTWPGSSTLGSLGHGWVPDNGKVLLWSGDASAKGEKGTFYNHVTHYDTFLIGYQNTSASSQTINYKEFKVTKHADGRMATSTVPIHDINLPQALGTQGNNFYWLYECDLHVVSDHFEVSANLRISDASDWHTAIPNTVIGQTDDKGEKYKGIVIKEVWGVIKNG